MLTNSENPADGGDVPDKGQQFAEKLELLLTMFPRPDGRSWRGSEIASATDGLVSQSYFSQLRNGKYRRPGWEQLAAIADVMGFPFELWRLDPEQWHDILGGEQHGERDVGDGQELAEKLRALVSAVFNPRTGKPYSDQEIAQFSDGRLSEAEVRGLRTGTVGQVTYDQLLALSDVFEVSLEYWRSPTKQGTPPVLDAELMDLLQDEDTKLLMNRTRHLSKSRKNMLLILAEQLQQEEGE